MRSLHHENLLKLKELYESDNSVYFVLELITGGNLLNYLKRNKEHVQIHKVQNILKQILIAAYEMHNQNIIHRDIKLENILLRDSSDERSIVIADFGLATKIDNPKQILFKRCGTPGFASPEIVSYEEKKPFYNEKCDVFSIGVILYILLTGKVPFPGDNQLEVIKISKKCQINYELPELQKAPSSVIELLKSMLSADPQTRFSCVDCLNHKFFQEKFLWFNQNDNAENTKLILDNLKKYEQDQTIKLQNKDPTVNKGQLDSMTFKQLTQPLLNGFTETVGSLSTYSNTQLLELHQKQNLAGKLKAQFQSKLNAKSPFNQEDNTSKSDNSQKQNLNEKPNVQNQTFVVETTSSKQKQNKQTGSSPNNQVQLANISENQQGGVQNVRGYSNSLPGIKIGNKSPKSSSNKNNYSQEQEQKHQQDFTTALQEYNDMIDDESDCDYDEQVMEEAKCNQLIQESCRVKVEPMKITSNNGKYQKSQSLKQESQQIQQHQQQQQQYQQILNQVYQNSNSNQYFL